MLKITGFLARFGLAFCFVSFGVWEIVKPQYWVSYVPALAARLGDPLLLVRFHGGVLLIIALMVAFGLFRRFASLIAVLLMLEIVASLAISSGFTEIVVRDIAILFLALAIMADAWRRR